MAKRRKNTNHLPTGQSTTRSIDTGHQMRGLLDRSRLLRARRFDNFVLRSIQVANRLETEDLRRDRYVQEENSSQIYRHEDGSPAFAVWREVNTPRMRFKGMPGRVRYEFQDADRTMVCQRRRARKAVIFALRKAGKGGSKNRRARWTDKSYISCRKGR